MSSEDIAIEIERINDLMMTTVGYLFDCENADRPREAQEAQLNLHAAHEALIDLHNRLAMDVRWIRLIPRIGYTLKIRDEVNDVQ